MEGGRDGGKGGGGGDWRGAGKWGAEGTVVSRRRRYGG